MSPYAPFEWILAMRFLREGTVQTALIMAGVGLGVGVIVFMSALLAGLQANVIRRTLNYMAPIVVVPPEQLARPLAQPGEAHRAVLTQPRAQRLRSIDQWQRMRLRIEAVPGVTAVTPVVAGPGYALRGEATKAVSITAIEPESYLRVIALAERIVAGKLDLGPFDIVVGTELARELGAAVGDKLRISTAAGRADAFTVAAVFDFGNRNVNERNVYVALRAGQSLLDLVGGASTLEVKVEDPFAAERIAQVIHAETGLQADSWIRTNAQFFTAMAAQTLANTLVRFFVGLTAALGIASVLVVSVVQKSKEIGILRATGTSRGQILRVFLLQGGFVGLAGSLAGSALGLAFLLAWRGMAVNPDGTPMFMVVIEPQLFLAASAGATLVGVLAAVVPARRAARLDPAVAIRG